MKFGVNTWVWLSPLTEDKLERLAPLVAELGFDWIEMPIEVIDQLDYGRAAEIARGGRLRGVALRLGLLREAARGGDAASAARSGEDAKTRHDRWRDGDGRRAR